jgi:DNA polymerase-1
MLVPWDEIDSIIEKIDAEEFLAIDTETTGLEVHHNDSLFSVIIATSREVFYFNFKEYPGLDPKFVLDKSELRKLNRLSRKTLFLANAKFDMHMLRREGVSLEAHRIWDVLAIQKCINNQDMIKYGLDNVARKYGYEKLSTVEDFVKKHRLFTWKQYPGKKTRTKNPHFDKVPLPLIQEYAERDGRITFDIGVRQIAQIDEIEAIHVEQGWPSFSQVILNECEVTQACFELECRGMQINKEFINEAIRYEDGRASEAKQRFRAICGVDLTDSPKSLSDSFKLVGLVGGTTEKGNASFTDDILEKIDHPLAEAVREFRDATKRASAYYKSFDSHADHSGVVHPSIRQTGADTFRFSITNPALQTLNKASKDPSPMKVRNSFCARPGFTLVAIDYKQQEYRLTADYAGEMELIRQINSGVDVHTATAALMGVTRDQAKTLNFMLLYGGGIAKLCVALFKPRLPIDVLKAVGKKYVYKYPDHRIKPEDKKLLERASQEDIDHDVPLLLEAQALQEKYFSTLPRVQLLVETVSNTAKERGFIFNFAGRRLHFPVKRFAYKSPNHLIQSSGAEIMRLAMIELRRFLKPHKSKILLSIHDEILFEMAEDEMHLIPELRRIMVSVYTPRNGCGMDTSYAIGKTWGAMEEQHG